MQIVTCEVCNTKRNIETSIKCPVCVYQHKRDTDIEMIKMSECKRRRDQREKVHILALIQLSNYTVEQVRQRLGISTSEIYRKLKKYEINYKGRKQVKNNEHNN
jgi:DNA-binding NtrC family response regulator